MPALLAGVVAGAVTMPVPAALAGPPPTVREMVVFPNGTAVGDEGRVGGVVVTVGRRRCAVGAATPLAALLRLRPGTVGLRDYGSCSSRAADGGGLYVRSIRGHRGRGQNGWVYKVGHKLATAGAGDLAGPFGRGRLRSGQRVTWFYCVYRSGCQRTLGLRARSEGGGRLAVSVRGHDDSARSVPVEGARVTAGGISARTDVLGAARLSLAPGRYVIRASKPGLVRSFGERVVALP